MLSERERDLAIRLIKSTPLDGKSEVVIRRATRNKKQNALLHMALSHISEQLVWPPAPSNSGTLHPLDFWKRACTLGWLLEEKSGGEVVSDLYGAQDKFGILVPHSSDLSADDMAGLVEWTFAFGAGNGVIFPPPKENGAALDDEAYERFR